MRRRNLYQPRAGWKLFSIRIGIANAVLAVGLWIGVGDIATWTTHATLWRVQHLAFLLISAVVVYFALLWLTGIRLQHLLIPQKQPI